MPNRSTRPDLSVECYPTEYLHGKLLPGLEELFHDQGCLCPSADLEPQWMESIRDYGVSLEDSAEFRDGVISLLGARPRYELENPDGVSALVIEGTLFEAMAAAVRLKSIDSNAPVPHWLMTVRYALRDSIQAIRNNCSAVPSKTRPFCGALASSCLGVT